MVDAIIMKRNNIVDLRELSRRPWCRIPYSCIVTLLLDKAGILGLTKKVKILDLTYGEGRMWYHLPSAYIVGFDIVKLNWLRKPQEFYNTSASNWKKKVGDRSFDIVAVDPPFMAYRRGYEKRKHYYDNKCSIGMLLREADKASRYYNAYLLVHFMWKVVPYGYNVIAEAWTQPFPYSPTYITWWGLLQPPSDSI